MIKFLILILAITPNVFAQKKDKNVVYKYKQYEQFDLGDLEIKGNILAPGDLTVKERKRVVFERVLFDRKNFNPEIREDIRNLK